MQHLVACHVLNLMPGELHSNLSGVTGHSQGILQLLLLRHLMELRKILARHSNGFSILAFAVDRHSPYWRWSDYITVVTEKVVEEDLEDEECPRSQDSCLQH